jgi:hypothetical protein
LVLDVELVPAEWLVISGSLPLIGTIDGEAVCPPSNPMPQWS